MLQSLTIRNIAVIERLHIEFEKGFSVLTGETGAGKSILLDSLGFVMGNRSQPLKLIREGEEEASVTLVLGPISSSIESFLTEQGFQLDSTLILRRTVTKEGRSKAFLNDQPISVALLSQISPHLIEIHGQFDHLLNAAQQREALDRYADLSTIALETAYHQWKEAEISFQTALHKSSDRTSRMEEVSFLIQELEQLAPRAHEEEELLILKEREKNTDHLQTILHLIEELFHEPFQAESRFLILQRHLEKLNLSSLSSLHQTVETMLICLKDIQADAQKIASTLESSPLSLDQIEGRLYALRQMARRHQVSPNDLGDILTTLRQEQKELTNSESSLEQLQQQVHHTKEAYKDLATQAYVMRQKAGEELAHKIKKSLEPLKLPHALFLVVFQDLPENQWSSKGMHQIEFYISTNPGLSPGPLAKIASGGELSRVMLAIKSILKEKTNIPTLIFDEIDIGLGGSVAAAMGEKLAHLSIDSQVLAITHSPQLAAYADYHFGVSKSITQGKTTTFIHSLENEARIEELSRMLSGKNITDLTRAAAEELLKDRVPI